LLRGNGTGRPSHHQTYDLNHASHFEKVIGVCNDKAFKNLIGNVKEQTIPQDRIGFLTALAARYGFHTYATSTANAKIVWGHTLRSPPIPRNSNFLNYTYYISG